MNNNTIVNHLVGPHYNIMYCQRCPCAYNIPSEKRFQDDNHALQVRSVHGRKRGRGRELHAGVAATATGRLQRIWLVSSRYIHQTAKPDQKPGKCVARAYYGVEKKFKQ